MSKIKYINCFGTSFTAGGGFEFEGNSPERIEFLNNFYSEHEIDLTQFRFSYPGQLEKLIGNNIVVTNYGKNGYGNDRMFRLIYDIVNQPDFNKDEHIFLIEYAGLGRREFWFNELNDYIICNYWLDWNTGTMKNQITLANSYCYDTQKTIHFLKKYETLFLEFLQHTSKLENEHRILFQNIEFFASYLKQKNLNYFYLTDVFEPQIGKNFTFGDGTHFKQANDFCIFSEKNDLSIKTETAGVYDDLHNGYKSNKIVALTIYNKLIDLGLLDLTKIDINWKELKEFKIKPKLKKII